MPLGFRILAPLIAVGAAGGAFLLADARITAPKAQAEPVTETRSAPTPSTDADGAPVYAKTEERVSALTRLQRWVTQQNGTERPFANAYWDNKEPGIYVDVVSGEPLFASTDKYESGTGWPSFVRPIDPENVVLHEDRRFGMTRIEVRSRHGDSHLGHVFNDGPASTGQRWCMNSAALHFIPVADLEAQGYGEYADLFADDVSASTAEASDTTSG